jgi:PKD repeat protein
MHTHRRVMTLALLLTLALSAGVLAAPALAETVTVVSYDIDQTPASGWGYWYHTYDGTMVDTGRTCVGSVAADDRLLNYSGGSGTINDGVTNLAHLFLTGRPDSESVPIIPTITLHLERPVYVQGISIYGGDWNNMFGGILTQVGVTIEGASASVPTTDFGWDAGYGKAANDLLDLRGTSLARVQTSTIALTDFTAPIDQFSIAEIEVEGSDVAPRNWAPVVDAVTAPSTVAVNSSLEASVSFADSDLADVHTAGWEWGDGSTTEGVVTESDGSGMVLGTHAYSVPGTYSVTVTVTDNDGLSGVSYTTITVSNPVPVIESITISSDTIETGGQVDVSAAFQDVGGGTHIAWLDWGDWAWTDGVIVEENGTGTISGSHVYTTPGIYTVKLLMYNSYWGSAEAQTAPILVYDPIRFVTGEGWIASPPGAYPADSELSGKATLSFAGKYVNGSSVPVGETRFRFGAARLLFESTAYEWIFVNGATAQLSGSGTVNGQGDYGFVLTAFDGKVEGSGTDLFRMRIWEKDSGATLYDNELTYPDDPLAVSTPLGAGSIGIQRASTGKPAAELVGAPYAGTRFYYSGSGNDLSNTMTKSVFIPDGASLSAKVNYEMEYGSDWAYLSVNGDPVYTNLSEWDPGITGSSEGEWIDLTADLSAYGGQTVTLGFRYVTDSSVVYEGLMIDEISIAGGPVDGAERRAGWTFDGFNIGTAKTTWIPS